MRQCDDCNRFLINDAGCPFCNRPARSGRASLGAMVMGVMTPIVLAACYGAPPIDTKDSGFRDADGDGYDIGADCDDTNADINPGATEICDDKLDNDCDGLTDGDDTDCAKEEG